MKEINIVSFDVPYPPDYGGVIDVFYKIKFLSEAGFKIHLHCFEYGRGRHALLENLCASVHYYSRKGRVEGNFSLLPYIVWSRANPELVLNLQKNNAPVFFEGLHSCYFMDDERLKGRGLIYRESNIEHKYYYSLFKASSSFGDKAFYLLESIRLKAFERIISKADFSLVVSQSDLKYLSDKYPGHTAHWLPSFHGLSPLQPVLSKEPFVLFHGNLSVPENSSMALYLIETMKEISISLVIAGKNPPSFLNPEKFKNTRFTLVPNPNQEVLDKLVNSATVNVALAPEPAGLKLKLLKMLFLGGHCLVNQHAVAGSGLDNFCHIANNPEFLKSKIINLVNTPFTNEEWVERKSFLEKNYTDQANGEKLLRLLSALK